MPWLQLSIDANDAQRPRLEALLEELGAVSLTLSDAGDQPQYEPLPGEERTWPATRITGLFEVEQDESALREALAPLLAEGGSANLSIERLEDQVWERAWLEHYHPMRFGRRLWIGPEDQLPDNPEGVCVKLDPGLAFGTGTHPTTALCLEWLDGQDLRGKTVIDYGCGSGILVIAALKLGAAHGVAIDYDPQALAATLENARKNGVLERLTIHPPEETPPGPYDLLIANILATPLIELAPKLCDLLKSGGELALSGVLEEQAEDVAQAYRERIQLVPHKQREEWMLISGTKG